VKALQRRERETLREGVKRTPEVTSEVPG